MSVFLPIGTRLDDVLSDGQPLLHASLQQTSMALPGVRDRPLIRHAWLLAPQQSAQLTAHYVVPHAAVVDRASGGLTRVDLDPQDLVQPQSNAITLVIPDGYRFGPLPVGWGLSDAHTAVLTVPQLTTSGSWRVPIVKD